MRPERTCRRTGASAAILAVMALVATGCSSGSSTSTSTGISTGGSTSSGSSGTAVQVPSANLPVLKSIGTGEGTLNLIAWEGYLQPQWVTPFEKQTGCQVHATYAGTSDQMTALMKNGGGGPNDMVYASGDADLRIIYAGYAHPVNIGLIPSWKQFFPAFQSPAFNTVNGVHYALSLPWDANVLMYTKNNFP